MEDDFLRERGRKHVLNKCKVRRGCTVSSPLTWYFTKISIGTECDNRFRGWLQHPAKDPVSGDMSVHGHHTDLICREFPSPMETAGQRPEFDIKLPLGARLQIFPQCYLLKLLPQGDIYARQRA